MANGESQVSRILKLGAKAAGDRHNEQIAINQPLLTFINIKITCDALFNTQDKVIETPMVLHGVKSDEFASALIKLLVNKCGCPQSTKIRVATLQLLARRGLRGLKNCAHVVGIVTQRVGDP